MAEGAVVLAIDQGGQSSRAVCYADDGTVLAQARQSVATSRPAPGHVEHDAEALIASVEACIDQALAACPAPVTAAGLATQRSSIAIWDRHTGRALAPVISWQDTRAASLLARLAPAAADIRAATGLVPSAHYGASKLRWCLDSLPVVRAAADDGRLAAGPLAAFVMHRLCAERPLLTDPVNASRTLLWDLAARDWSPPLLAAFGVPRDVLPDCVANRHPFGTLARHDIGLRVCTGDQNAALAAGGAIDAGHVYINLGTGAFVLAPCTELPPDSALLRSLVWDDGVHRTFALEGTVNGAAAALAGVLPDRPASFLAEAAAAIGRVADTPLFLNGIGDLGSPYWRPLESRFVGAGDALARAIAVFESIVFLVQENLAQIPGSRGRVLVVSGGLANHDGLCAALASLSGRPVLRGADTEATARGLAQLVAGHSWRAQAAQRFAPQARPALADRYRQWRAELARALDGAPAHGEPGP